MNTVSMPKYLRHKCLNLSSIKNICNHVSGQFSSVARSCLTLSDPVNHSTPGLPVHHNSRSSPKFMSIESVKTSNHLILCRPLLLLPSIFPESRSFQMSQLFTWGGQSSGISASTSVLPKNNQDWCLLGWTGWISLQSKGFSRLLSTPQFKNINSSALSFLYSPTLTSIHDHWKNHSLD